MAGLGVPDGSRASPRWRKSSYSVGASGNCTEVATVPGAVLVRDSKDPNGPVLAFGHAAWQAFAAAARADARAV